MKTAGHIQLRRQWRLVRYLSENPGGCQVEELCRAMETTPRTLYRDLADLDAAGFPIMNRREGRIAVWSIGPWWAITFRDIG